MPRISNPDRCQPDAAKCRIPTSRLTTKSRFGLATVAEALSRWIVPVTHPERAVSLALTRHVDHAVDYAVTNSVNINPFTINDLDWHESVRPLG
jgi:hypothetical protein